MNLKLTDVRCMELKMQMILTILILHQGFFIIPGNFVEKFPIFFSVGREIRYFIRVLEKKSNMTFYRRWKYGWCHRCENTATISTENAREYRISHRQSMWNELNRPTNFQEKKNHFVRIGTKSHSLFPSIHAPHYTPFIYCLHSHDQRAHRINCFEVANVRHKCHRWDEREKTSKQLYNLKMVRDIVRSAPKHKTSDLVDSIKYKTLKRITVSHYICFSSL